MKLTSFLCFLALFLVGCGGSSGPSAFSSFLDHYYSSLNSSSTLASVKMPVLKSPSFEKKWGAPKIRTSVSGNYELNYANPDQPFDRLVIQGSPVPFPALKKAPKISGEEMIKGELTGVEYPQDFRTVMIAGQKVRWYQESISGGADGAYYATEGFVLTDDKGQAGYYRMMVEAGNNAHAEVAKRFATGQMGR